VSTVVCKLVVLPHAGSSPHRFFPTPVLPHAGSSPMPVHPHAGSSPCGLSPCRYKARLCTSCLSKSERIWICIKGDVEKISSVRNKTSSKTDHHQKTSKMDAFEERTRKCARDMEKVRGDYLKECSKYYDKNLNRFMMREKRNKMKWDKTKIDSLVDNHEHEFRHVKMRQRRDEQ